MTAFRQGPTPWYRLDDEGNRWMARGVDREAMETAMRWAGAEPKPQPRRDEQTDFVRDAIQRAYQ